MAKRCFCPPDKLDPFSSISLLYLAGIFSINSFEWLTLHKMAIVAAERLNEIFELAPEQEGEEKNKLKKISLKKDIRIVDLNFRYGTRKLILKNINMNINVGDKVALVGESGSGKSTLARVLLGQTSPQAGNIYFDSKEKVQSLKFHFP